ncbi:DUF3261 domain-containing protein [Kangiella sp. HD9-110m-PIT-SAG07]|nr:DUF3261 domain-containing protein [Kangiella sp. HD9-110m-PIT-SAG07]
MRFIILLAAILFLTACTTHYTSQQNNVLIANQVQFNLLSTIPFKNGLTLTQSATVTYQDESQDLIFHTEIRDQTLTMVGLTPTGTRLFTIVTQEGNIRADGFSSIVDNIKPEYLLADMQLSLWPISQLRSNIQGASLEEPDPLTRQLTNGNKPLVSIYYSEAQHYQGYIEFTHHQRDYNLILTPLSIEYSSHE